MLMIPVVLLALLLVVQFGLAYYARQVLAGAAQDGAAAAGRQGSSPATGVNLTETLIEEAGGSLFDSHTATANGDGNLVTVQNPSAGAAVADLMLQALFEKIR